MLKNLGLIKEILIDDETRASVMMALVAMTHLKSERNILWWGSGGVLLV